jgi:hypothetical protein
MIENNVLRVKTHWRCVWGTIILDASLCGAGTKRRLLVTISSINYYCSLLVTVVPLIQAVFNGTSNMLLNFFLVFVG